MESEIDSLALILTREQGKPIREAVSEIQYAIGFYRHAAALPDPVVVEQGRRADGLSATVYSRPAGVAALIVPWNFPLAMLAKKLASALAAGCPVIVKPSDETPLTAVAFWSLLEQVDFPPGFVNLVCGPPRPIGEVICKHPAVRVISVTGSTATGRWIYEKAAQGLKRLVLELGGNAPFLVFEDADLDLAADSLIANKFRCSGQTCVCANRVFVHDAVKADFLERLKQRMAKLRVGNGMDAAVDIGPLINRKAFERARRLLEDALQSGALPMLLPEIQESKADWGNFFPPVLLADVSPEMEAFREEVFSPLVLCASFSSETDVIAEANNTPYGLAAYLFTADPKRAERCVSALRFGHVAVNSGSGPSPEFAFGGMKASGFGREGGNSGILEYTELQTVIRRGLIVGRD